MHAIYAPAAPSSPQETGPDTRRHDFWNRIDPNSLRVHRMGTTSLIARGHRIPRARESDEKELAVKYVLYPWNTIPAIARATESYEQRYAEVESRIGVKAKVASDRWIVMDFVDTPTLAEAAHAYLASGDQPWRRVVLARVVGHGLLEALGALARDGSLEHRLPEERQHLDLSPSNVLVEVDDSTLLPVRFRFIDLGTNTLYSRQAGVADHDDAIFVSPEVKRRGREATSDVYSLGVILTELLSGVSPRDGTVPEALGTLSPELGRWLEDALDQRHERRLSSPTARFARSRRSRTTSAGPSTSSWPSRPPVRARGRRCGLVSLRRHGNPGPSSRS